MNSAIRAFAPSRFILFVLVLAIASLVATVCSARAALTFLSQDRSVITFATVDLVEGDDLFSNDLFEAQNTDVFDGQANCHVGEPGDQATSAAHQLSYLLPGTILAEGSMQGSAEISSAASFAEAFGGTVFQTVFQVGTPTEVHLQLAMFAGGNGSTNFTLRVQSGTILVNRTTQQGEDDIDEFLTLQPGNYEVFASSTGYGQALPNGGGQPASGSYSFSMIVTGATAAPVIGSGMNSMAPIVAPNPLRHAARILPAAGTVDFAGEIAIVDLGGRVVRRFTDVGAGGVTWDAKDAQGHPVAAGMYLVSGGNGATARAVVVR